MYRLSLWAHLHVWSARFLIIAANLFLLALGWLLGHQWTAIGVAISPMVFYTGALLALLGFFAYPSKRRKKGFKHFYAVQKTCDGLLATGAFVMMMCTAQQNAMPPSWGMQAQATELAVQPVPSTAKQKTSFFKKVTGQLAYSLGFNKGMGKKLKANWQQLRLVYKDISKGGKVALIILSILVGAGLIFLALALACGIACNGSGALALLVALGGIGLVIFLLVKIIDRIQKGPKTPKVQEPAPAASPL